MLRANIHKVNDLPVIVINDFFSTESLTRIWNELIFLNDHTNKMRTADQTGGGYYVENGHKQYLKNNLGTVLDAVYSDESISSILTETKQIFDKNFVDSLCDAHSFFKLLTNVNKVSTKVHYYENDHYYKPHYDASVLTVTFWFYKQPKKFKNGDLILENDFRILCENNTCAIMPSILTHEVNPIIMNNEDAKLGYGRYSVNQFLFIEDKL